MASTDHESIQKIEYKTETSFVKDMTGLLFNRSTAKRRSAEREALVKSLAAKKKVSLTKRGDSAALVKTFFNRSDFARTITRKPRLTTLTHINSVGR